MTSKVWGYSRSSTDHQTVRAQLTALENSNPKPDRIFIDEGITRKATATVIAIALGIALASCSVKDEPNENPPVAPNTGAPVVSDANVGQLVDADSAAAINAERDGNYAFDLGDGTFAVVNKDEVVPAVVQEKLNAEGAAANAAATPEDNGQWGTEVVALISDTRAATGKPTIVIAKVVGIRSSTDSSIVTWYVPWGAVPKSLKNIQDSGSGYDTQAEAIAAVEAYIATQKNPDAFVIITG